MSVPPEILRYKIMGSQHVLKLWLGKGMFHLTSLSAVVGGKEGHAPCNNLSVVIWG